MTAKNINDVKKLKILILLFFYIILLIRISIKRLIYRENTCWRSFHIHKRNSKMKLKRFLIRIRTILDVRLTFFRILFELGPIGAQLASQMLLGSTLHESVYNSSNKLSIVQTNNCDEGLKAEIKMLLRTQRDISFSDENFENAYSMALKSYNNGLTNFKELERVLSVDRGGADVSGSLLLFIIYILLQRSNGFQPDAPRPPAPPHQEIWFDNNKHNNINDQKGCTSRGPESLQAAKQQIIESEQYADAVTGIANDGKAVSVRIKHARKKGYHMPDFLSDREIKEHGGDLNAIKKYSKGKSPFSDKTKTKDGKDFENERSKYFVDEKKVPPSLIRLFAERLVDFCRRDDVKSAPGLMAWKETPGTVFIDVSKQIVAFRDQTGEIRSGCKLRQQAFTDFLTGEKMLHLYPDAGKPFKNKE